MDAETALFVVSAALAAFWSTVIGILHVRGWLPKAYISRLRDIQAQTASQVGEAVSVALRAVSVEARAIAEETADPLPEQLQIVLHAELQAAADALKAGIEALPTQMEAAVENALNRVAATQKAEYAVEAAAAAKSVEMSMVRGVRSLGDVQAKVDNAMAEAILGPALPILRQFAPGLAETLEENPQLIGVIIENPLFKKYIEPRILQFMGKQSGIDTGKNPFLGELGQ